MAGVIDETWVVGSTSCPDYSVRQDAGDGMLGPVVCEAATGVWEPEQQARMSLAACAPEMVRLLLAAEWSSLDGRYEPDHSTCPHCGGVKSEEYDETAGRESEWRLKDIGSGWDISAWAHRGHKPECRWLAVMRKAGLRP